MTQLLELSNEILLSIASFLCKVDLLNITLVCKSLHEATEPELYSVYSNPQMYGVPISLFVLRLIRRPDLIPCVRKLELKGWDSLEGMHPRYYGSSREEKAIQFQQDRSSYREPSEEEYITLTAVARSAGVIRETFPFEKKSHILDEAGPMLCLDTIPDLHWDTFIYDDKIRADQIPFDRKFCQQLRAGIEEPYAILLVSMVGQVKTVFFREIGPQSPSRSELPWPQPKHRFQNLQHLRAGSIDGGLSWGIGYFNTILSSAVNLKHIQFHNSSSWFPNIEMSETLSLEQRAVRCNLKPDSLPTVTKLEFTGCMMTWQDMQSLLLACPQLKSLYYTSFLVESMDDDVTNFSPGDLIALLQPFQTTLQELHIDIETAVAPPGPPTHNAYADTSYIISLRDFTALHTLVTDPCMWAKFVIEDDAAAIGFPISELDTGDGICTLLPPALKKLYFMAQYIGLDNDDICDIIESRRQLLPDLEEVLIEVKTAKHALLLEEELNMLVDVHGYDVADVSFKYGIAGSLDMPLTDPFLGEIPCRHLPHVRWFDHKYSVRRRRGSKALEWFIERHDRYDDDSVSSEEISRRIIDDSSELDEDSGEMHEDSDSERELEEYESESDESQY